MSEKRVIDPLTADIPEGDKMCRNGRYFAVITVDDGTKVKRFRQEVILFK